MNGKPAAIVAISGGLGNQMFQYAFGRALSTERRAELVLDLRPVESDKLRSFSLGAMCIEATLGGESDLVPLPGVLARKLKLHLPVRGTGYVLKSVLAYDPRVVAKPLPSYFWGNWQSERYFHRVADLVRDDFRLRAPLSPARAVIADEIRSRLSVAVHVRRGDYVLSPKTNAYHGTLSPPWYQRAATHLEKLVGAPRYFVFSDDLQWAKTHLTCIKDARFIGPPSDGKDSEDLHLMALCEHQIIANSSFSWWAAWLNRNVKKHVIAPLKWFNHARLDTRDLLPPSWIRL